MSSLADLRTSTRRLLGEEDTSNTHFDDNELNDYLNQATGFLGVQMEWSLQTSIATAVIGQALYALPDDFVSLLDAYFDNGKLIVLEREDLNSINSRWQDASSGTPKIIYKADNAVVGLYPPPDSLNDGLELQVQYIKVPATLSEDVDVPDVHMAFQVCLPFYAAYLGESKLGNDKKATLHMQSYDLHRKALMSKVQSFSDDLLRFRWRV